MLDGVVFVVVKGTEKGTRKDVTRRVFLFGAFSWSGVLES